MIRPPEHVSAIEPYVPGKPVEELERELGIKGSVKLASNENPAGPSKKALEALTPEVMGDLNRYPDGGAFYLTKALVERHGVSEDQIILGNGSNELIDIAVRTFMRPGDEAVMAWPSFVVYPMSVQAQGCRGVRVPLRDYRHDLGGMAEAVTEKTSVVFIANPNNPTGTINTKDEFDSLMERLPDGILVLVDEAYCEYVESADYADALKHMRSGRNVLVLRTFSKIYGLAGLRIGYGITAPDIARDMNRVREPFNTNSLAQAAALAALSDAEHVERSKRINGEGKAFLYRELDAMGIKYVPTEANFIFMFPGRPSAEVYGELLKRGVIVRPMGEDSIRVTIGLPEENERFVEGMKAALS
ncbi:MAG: histidinol-phosphate transaminase [Nitrospirota bacterium]|jgi:histidinol-phosphate aminotransferase